MLLKSSTTHGTVFGRGTGGSANAVLADPITSSCDGLDCWERTDVVNKNKTRIDVPTTDLGRIERRFFFIGLFGVNHNYLTRILVGQRPTQPNQSMNEHDTPRVKGRTLCDALDFVDCAGLPELM